MKIGYLVPEFPGQTHGFFWREILHIEAAGDVVELLSTRRPIDKTKHTFSDLAANRTLYLSEIRLMDLWSWIRATLAAIRILAKIDFSELQTYGLGRLKIFAFSVIGAKLAAHCRKNGIEHIHGHSCADVGYILALSRLCGGPPYSLSLHGDLAVYGNGHFFKFRHAKFIACVTNALCEQVQTQIPQLGAKPILIRMGIDQSSMEGRVTDWSPQGALNIVTVARLNPMKGHKHAIAVVKFLKDKGIDVHYDIIGEGNYYNAIAEQIRDAGLQNEITMLGPLSNDQIVERLSRYDAFVLPSIGLGEAAPVAVMEAMSAGIPTVCSIIGGTPEMIENNRTGFLFPQCDEAALADILEGLACSLETRKRIGDAGQAFAHANFLTSVSAAKLVTSIRQ